MPPPTIKARPTVYNGIKMRSRLEAHYAAYLDANNHPWQYEPECFATETGQYLPDFAITDQTEAVAYIEVKPEPILRDTDSLINALDRMEIIWKTHPNANLLLDVADERVAKTLGRPSFPTRFSAMGSRPWFVQSWLIGGGLLLRIEDSRLAP